MIDFDLFFEKYCGSNKMHKKGPRNVYFLLKKVIAIWCQSSSTALVQSNISYKKSLLLMQYCKNFLKIAITFLSNKKKSWSFFMQFHVTKILGYAVCQYQSCLICIYSHWPKRVCAMFIQNRTGSWVLLSLYVFSSINVI